MAKKKGITSALHEKEGVPQPETLSTTVANQLKKSRKKTPSTKELIQGILQKDITALSRAITLVESTAPKHQKQAKEVIEACLPYANKSIRIGITGVPGVGKSSFIEQFGKILVQKNQRVP